jgi:hypothetical protein
MFKLLLQISFLIYIILIILNLRELKNYNKNGYIFKCDDVKDISSKLIDLNPLYFKTEYNYNQNINDIEDCFKDKQPLKDIFYDYNDIKQNMNDNLLFYNESITSYKTKKSSDLILCKHNYNILSILFGECKVYLINPKHKNDIIGKENIEIKKWAHIKKLEKYDNICIPTNWYYFIESNDKLVIHHLDIDNYFTIIPNFLKERFKL